VLFMAFRRLTSRVGSVELSDEQALVLACLEAGLDEADMCASTGLDARRLDVVVRGLRLLQEAVRQADAPAQAAPAANTSEAAAVNDSELPDGIEPWSGEPLPEGTASSHDLHAPGAEDDAAASAPPAGDDTPIDELNFRRIYETRFRDLDTGLRQDAALHSSGSELFALCLDPAPEVIAALLDNSHFGLAHARMVALHHKTPTGIEQLARRAQLLRDQHVQRRLLQNLQTPDNVIDRVLRYKRLLDIYRLSIDRDLPERNRGKLRARLRPCFTKAEPEERAALIIKTEGRCLVALSGCTFDGRTTQILCNQSILSTLFIQNLARFPATPAALIAKLLRSPAVQRQPQLRMLLARHPNAGGEGKR
jgi:hypothetical protein